MIEIVRPGYKKIVECRNCGAILRYDKRKDVQEKAPAGHIGYMIKYIICPECQEHVNVNTEGTKEIR